MTTEVKPAVGELVRWTKTGPVVLQIERVGSYAWDSETWWVYAGHVWMQVTPDTEDENVGWQRVAS